MFSVGPSPRREHHASALASLGVPQSASSVQGDRVGERRRAVALAYYFREAEGLSIAQIAGRLGRSPATIKAYFYDPSDANKRPTNTREAAASQIPPGTLGTSLAASLLVRPSSSFAGTTTHTTGARKGPGPPFWVIAR